jgi:hypothetical protein
MLKTSEVVAPTRRISVNGKGLPAPPWLVVRIITSTNATFYAIVYVDFPSAQALIPS